MSDRPEIEQAVNLYFVGMNTNDTSIIPLSADVVMSGPMMPEPISGESAVRQYLDETSPFIARIDVESILVDGDQAATMVEFEALNGVVFKGAQFFKVRDGLITADIIFFDTRLLLKGAS